MELKGKTALITGSCGKGIGRSTALRLAREGVNIVLNYGTYHHGTKILKEAEEIVEAVETLCGQAIVQEADTRNEEQVKAMVETANEKFGGVDILVNNACGEWDMRDYTTIEFDQWKSVLSAEIDGAFLTMKHAVPGMRERAWGRVIHIGLEGVFLNPGAPAPACCLGKAARSWMAIAFSKMELENGITMNCIEPGLTPHMSLEDAVRVAQGDHLSAEVAALAPESGKPKWKGLWRDRPGPMCHDVAEIVAFLCSDAGRFLSGQVISLPHFR